MTGNIIHIYSGLIPFVITSLLLVITWRIKVLRYLLFGVLILFFVSARVQNVTPKNNPDWWGNYTGKNVKEEFVIQNEPKVSGKSQIFLVKSVDKKPRGNIEVSTNQFPQKQFGDIVRIDGKLLPIDQNLGYMKSQQIVARISYPKIDTNQSAAYSSLTESYYYNIRGHLIDLKNSYVEKTGQILPEPEAGLLSGIIFGTKAELSTALLSILAITGTVHIIALSGYNITIVAKGSQYLTNGLNRNLAFLVPVLGITLFVLATGLSASVVRAAVMGTMLLLAARLGRQSDALNAVLFASVLMAIVNPYIVLYDIGFQLSFAAVGGIIFLQPVIEKYFQRLGNIVGPILAGTVAAQIFSWPVIAYYFGRVSLVGIVANALILPLIPLIMLLGFVVVTIGFASLGIAKILGSIVWFLLYYTIKVNEILAGVKLASLNYQNPSIYLVIGYFLLLLEVTYFLNQRRKKSEV